MNKYVQILIAFILGFASFWVFSNVIKPENSNMVVENLYKETKIVDESTMQTNDEPTSNKTKGKSLDISNQGLIKLPSYVLSSTDLEELNISNNNIGGALPSEIGKLKNLKVLNVSGNVMTGVPAEIGQLSKLEILDLSRNKLTGLPYELGNLKQLKILDLSGNDYSEQDLNVIRKGLSPDVDIIL